jgi:hypothetical protein
MVLFFSLGVLELRAESKDVCRWVVNVLVEGERRENDVTKVEFEEAIEE